MNTKVCTQCSVEKPLDAFYKDGRAKSGFRSECRHCANERSANPKTRVPTPLSKVCRTCGQEKPAEEFHRAAHKPDGLSIDCGACKYEPSKDYMLRRNYGIDLGVYKAMERDQGGVCRICNRPPKIKALAVDYCHDTGRVRGLLCWPCNRFLGHIGDDRELLARMIQYLNHVEGPVER